MRSLTRFIYPFITTLFFATTATASGVYYGLPYPSYYGQISVTNLTDDDYTIDATFFYNGYYGSQRLDSIYNFWIYPYPSSRSVVTYNLSPPADEMCIRVIRQYDGASSAFPVCAYEDEDLVIVSPYYATSNKDKGTGKPLPTITVKKRQHLNEVK